MPRDPAKGGPSDSDRFRHMLDAARDIRAMTAGRVRAEINNDVVLRRALVNAIQEIGEAASRVSEDGRKRVPSLPWGQIVAARHIMVHVYWGVDLDQLWRMALEDVPVLIAAIESAPEE